MRFYDRWSSDLFHQFACLTHHFTFLDVTNGTLLIEIKVLYWSIDRIERLGQSAPVEKITLIWHLDHVSIDATIWA